MSHLPRETWEAKQLANKSLKLKIGILTALLGTASTAAAIGIPLTDAAANALDALPASALPAPLPDPGVPFAPDAEPAPVALGGCSPLALACVIEAPDARSPRPAGASGLVPVFVSAPCSAIPVLCDRPNAPIAAATPAQGETASAVNVDIAWEPLNAAFAVPDSASATLVSAGAVTVELDGIGPVTVFPCTAVNPCLAGARDAWTLTVSVTVGDVTGSATRVVAA